MEDLIAAACTLVLLTVAVVSGLFAVLGVGAWVIALFQGDLFMIVGALPTAVVCGAFSRLFWRLI